ncbi:Uncharacterized protein Adt_27170 [Abeliophyllum distichum]|uniref:Uncharacterized protein n=1 Tax=Abeliophyllum distichum TaxID=126358 RepID=A0ABD1RV19_9LAMI
MRTSRVSNFRLIDEPVEDEHGIGLDERGWEPVHGFYQAWEIFSSIKMDEQLVDVQNLYNILVDTELILSGPFQTADRPPLGSIAIHSLSMKSGLRLSFHFFFRELLNTYNLAPTQLGPNL